jgi:hypothetical protein
VVLIDAGSTLTQDDLATVEMLYAAGIPASLLLSKADLLAPADLDRALQFVAGHIRSDLGLELPVYAISVKAENSGLPEKWLDTEILPLLRPSRGTRATVAKPEDRRASARSGGGAHGAPEALAAERRNRHR